MLMDAGRTAMLDSDVCIIGDGRGGGVVGLTEPDLKAYLLQYSQPVSLSAVLMNSLSSCRCQDDADILILPCFNTGLCTHYQHPPLHTS